MLSLCQDTREGSLSVPLAANLSIMRLASRKCPRWFTPNLCGWCGRLHGWAWLKLNNLNKVKGRLVEVVKGLETLGFWNMLRSKHYTTRLILQRTPVWQLDLYLYAILASRLFDLLIRSSRQSQVLRSVGPESVDIVPWAHSPKVHRYLRMWFSSSRGKLTPILNYRTACQWHKPQPAQLLKLYLIMFPAHKSCWTHRSRSGAPHTFRASNVKHLLYNIF